MAEDYGIRVSAPNEDVKDPVLSDPDSQYSFPTPQDTYFSSGWFTWKIIATGTMSQSIPDSSGTHRLDTVSTAHSLGYAPMVMMFFSVNGGATWFSNNADTEGNATGTPLRIMLAQSTDSNVTAEIFTIDRPTYTLQIRYIIYADVGE